MLDLEGDVHEANHHLLYKDTMLCEARDHQEQILIEELRRHIEILLSSEFEESFNRNRNSPDFFSRPKKFLTPDSASHPSGAYEVNPWLFRKTCVKVPVGSRGGTACEKLGSCLASWSHLSKCGPETILINAGHQGREIH